MKNVCDILGHCLGGLKSMNLWLFLRGRWRRRKSGYCQLRWLALYRKGCIPSKFLEHHPYSTPDPPYITYITCLLIQTLLVASFMWTSAFSVAPNWGMFDVSQNSLFGWFIYMGLKVTFLFSQSPSWRLHLNIQTCPNPNLPPQKGKLLVVENSLYPPFPSRTSTTSPLPPAPFPKAHSHGLQDRGGWMERWSQRAILWRQEWRGEATKPRDSLGRVIHSRW